MNLELTNSVAIVTGGSAGIGEGITRSFLAEGARVVMVGRDLARGQALQEELNQAYPGAVQFYGIDLAQPENCKAVVDFTLSTYGQINVVVNNAGVNDSAGLDAGIDAFVGSLFKNLIHYYAMVHYALPSLKKTKGNIVNVGSKVAETGQGNTSGYAASKGGVHGLTREWAADLVAYGIRSNEVVPAEVWTPQYHQWISSTPNPEARKRAITKHIPLGHRFTTIQEIADMVVFLASARASHITGQIMYVDGGYTHLDRSIS